MLIELDNAVDVDLGRGAVRLTISRKALRVHSRLLTQSQQQRTLDEVRDFALTDMDRGGQDRWTYRMLQEPALSEHLETLAGPRTLLAAGAADTVHFQPCRSWHHRSQDRYAVEEWALPAGGPGGGDGTCAEDWYDF